MSDAPRRALITFNDTVGDLECAACPARNAEGTLCLAYGQPLRRAVQGKRVRARRVYACVDAEREARKALATVALVKAWRESKFGDRDRDLLLGLAKLDSL